MDFNYIDITIIVIILITALIGFMRGFVWMAIFLATWTAAILLGYTYKEQVASMLPVKLDSEAMLLGLAFLLIFIGTLIAGAIINYLFSKAVSAIGLGTFDRILGMGLGIILGALGVTLVTMLLSFTELPTQDAWGKSKLLPKFKEAEAWIKTIVPNSVNELIDSNIPSSSSTTAAKSISTSTGSAIITPSTTIETPSVENQYPAN